MPSLSRNARIALAVAALIGVILVAAVVLGSVPSSSPGSTSGGGTGPSAPSTEALPTGLSYVSSNDSVVVKEHELVKSHAEQLNGTSFTVKYVQSDSKRSKTILLKRGSNGEKYLSRSTPRSSIEVYRADSPGFLRATSPKTGEPRYLTTMSSLPGHGYMSGGGFLSVAFHDLTLAYENTSAVNGETVHTLSVTGVRDAQRLAQNLRLPGNVSEASGTVKVAASGIIRSADVTITVSSKRKSMTFTHSFTVAKVGETNPEPKWLDKAKQQAVQMDASVNDKSVSFKKTGGGTIKNGTDVKVFTGNGQYNATLTESVENGETVYVAVTDTTQSGIGQKAVVSVGEPVTGTVSGSKFRAVQFGTGPNLVFRRSITALRQSQNQG